MTVLILLLSGITGDGASHAVAATAATTELLAGDRVNLDSGCGQPRIGRLVSLVRDDDAGRERHEVVAVVPLVALGLELVATCRHGVQLLEAERVRDLVDERSL